MKSKFFIKYLTAVKECDLVSLCRGCSWLLRFSLRRKTATPIDFISLLCAEKLNNHKVTRDEAKAATHSHLGVIIE